MQEIVVHTLEVLERRLDVSSQRTERQTPAENHTEPCSDLSLGGFMGFSSNGFMGF